MKQGYKYDKQLSCCSKQKPFVPLSAEQSTLTALYTCFTRLFKKDILPVKQIASAYVLIGKQSEETTYLLMMRARGPA